MYLSKRCPFLFHTVVYIVFYQCDFPFSLTSISLTRPFNRSEGMWGKRSKDCKISNFSGFPPTGVKPSKTPILQLSLGSG